MCVLHSKGNDDDVVTKVALKLRILAIKMRFNEIL